MNDYSSEIRERAATLGVGLPDAALAIPWVGEPRRSTKYRVREAIARLASDAWHRREVPGELERAEEISALARDQVNDDVYHTGAGQRDRIGNDWVGHYDHSNKEAFTLWPARSDDQLALEAGLRPYLDQLEGEERLLVRWRFEGQLSVREIAKLLSRPVMTVHGRIKALQRRLRALLLEAYPVPEGAVEPEAVEASDPWAKPWETGAPQLEEPAWLDEPYVPVPRQPVGHITFAGAP